MSRDFRLSMGLDFKDNASRDMARVLRDGVKQATDATRAAERQGDAQKKAATDATQAEKQHAETQRRDSRENISASRRQVEEYRRSARARETLAVRSERAIQREIDRTTAAYNRLSRSGTLTAREQSRAYTAMKNKVAALNGEMGNLTRLERVRMAGGQIGAISGGIVAAAMPFVAPVKNQMAYEHSQANLANTAFYQQDAEGRLARLPELNALIHDAIVQGGGTKDNAQAATGRLLNTFSFDEIKTRLPFLQQVSSGTGVSGETLGDISNALRRHLGVDSAEDLKRAINMMVASGQAGGVELADIARILPGQLEQAGRAGLRGLDGLAQLLSADQVSLTTSGSVDEAGAQVNALLQRIYGNRAEMAAQRIKIGGKGIDLHGTLAQAQLHGMSPLDALVSLSDRIIDHDPKIRALRKKLNSGNLSDSEAASTRDALQTMENDWLTKLLGDPYSVRAMTALRNQRQARADNLALTQRQRDLPDGQGAAEVNFQTISGTSDFKTDQAKSLRELSQMDAMRPVADAAGKFADVVAEFNQKFPGLSQAAESASLAIQSMTAAAVMFAGLKLLLGKGGAGAVPGNVLGDAGAVAAGAASTSGNWLSGLFKVGAAAMAVTTAATATTPEEDEAVNGSAERWKAIREKYPQELIDAARKKYQPWYQFGEGYSTENEKWIQQYLQDMNKGGGQDAIPPRAVPRPAASQDIIQPGQVPGVTPGRSASDTAADISANNADRPLEVHTHLHLDGREIAETVNEYNGYDVLRSTGGGF
ncbi:tail length tape measure protein [Salmonella enterica]|uniref:Tail length tape measure protein n=1 Tax=Salmonella enterica subsp. enterica serovar Pensacola TaxID=34042 RepID=A0A602YVP7_SALET|nr:tail length tape measure protein [Salmonella enterica]EBO9448596.1 phage tail tape measure protein [Salmonella enterica]ECT8495232.1 tail length tape measure protein [Salmonella enterica subsp. enterica serovar Pensacola]EDJ0351651.1 tail length tape measure protein [Salmonella enterica]EKO4097052.1 tail length tape measure protein [Salmonella enterica]